jgi:hypothetical protein
MSIMERKLSQDGTVALAARLQSCQNGTRPTLIRIETTADTLSFVWKNFGLE